MQEVAHNWLFSFDVVGLLSESMLSGCRQLLLMSLGCRRWMLLGGSRYRWVVVDVVGFSSMSLNSRLHCCTVHVDEWLPLPLTGFAVDGLDCSSIRCVHVIRQGVENFRVMLWLRLSVRAGNEWGGKRTTTSTSWAILVPLLPSLAYSSSIK